MDQVLPLENQMNYRAIFRAHQSANLPTCDEVDHSSSCSSNDTSSSCSSSDSIEGLFHFDGLTPEEQASHEMLVLAHSVEI